MSTRPTIVAITGASGAVYGVRTLEVMLAAKVSVDVILSRDALSIVADETGLALEKGAEANERILRDRFATDRLRVYDDDDFYTPPASGSHQAAGMIVIPCSMKTLASIAHGISGSLITRAADVTIKEGRSLVLVPRETPLSAVHLENMLKLARVGVRIVPPVPGFYTKPASVADVVDFVVGKVLDQAGIDHDLFPRWGGR